MVKSSTQTPAIPIGNFVLENMSEGVIVTDEEGIIVYTNPPLEHMYGYTAEELNGQDISILYPKLNAGGDGFHTRILPKLQTEGKWQGGMATVNKGGQQVGVTVRYSQCIHENQHYWIGFHENILELENVMLGTEHIPIKKFLDVMPDTFEIFDPNTMSYLLWNEAVNKFSGRTDAEVAVMNPTDGFLDPTELPRVNAAVEQVLVEGKPIVDLRMTVIHTDGTRIPMEYTGGVINDDVGAPLYLVAVGRDIREQLKFEEELKATLDALKQSEEKYRDLVEKISDVIYSADANGIITYINPAIELLLGFRPEQVVGQPITQFIHPEDFGKMQENVQNLISEIDFTTTEYRVLTASGKIRWIRVNRQPIIQADKVVGLHGVLTDITKHKKIGEQREMAATLAERERLARRLHDAVTQTLFSASVMAESTPRIMTENPELAERNLAQLSIMLRGALAEMRTMLIELRPSALIGKPLEALIQTLVEANQGILNNIITLDVAGEHILPEVVTIAFYRITQEAINNIIKHAEADEVIIRVSINDETMVTIKDNGLGFDSAKIPIGHFGLSIMAERMEQIGGILIVESKLGQGTQVIASWSAKDAGGVHE